MHNYAHAQRFKEKQVEMTTSILQTKNHIHIDLSVFRNLYIYIYIFTNIDEQIYIYIQINIYTNKYIYIYEQKYIVFGSI